MTIIKIFHVLIWNRIFDLSIYHWGGIVYCLNAAVKCLQAMVRGVSVRWQWGKTLQKQQFFSIKLTMWGGVHATELQWPDHLSKLEAECRALFAYVSRPCRFLKVLWVSHWAAVHSEGNTSLKRLTKGGLHTSPGKVILILLIQSLFRHFHALTYFKKDWKAKHGSIIKFVNIYIFL